jgi:FMN reductase (NADPH)
LRNQLAAVSELLHTPDRVIPLFGLSVGYPANPSDQKPRLPMSAVYYEDGYIQNEQLLKAELDHYNRVISAYYEERTGGARSDRWTEAMTRQLSQPKRLYMKSHLASKKLPLD